MNSEVKIDILFAGLLLIPILILAVPFIKNKLVSLSRGKAFSIISLPISAYLIYDISIESNVFGLIGLCVAYIVFFSTYAASISLLAVSTKNEDLAQ
ncbi:hypothetical protein [Pseudoalteromonas sp. meg-B1]|jgi:hypothetical protein|uniref:hypothetical protein n=1 Tax=Pseudoalteromonas sp. meg-B1 TaxID=2203192 RepID=UPI000D6F97E7|nr:hypothetical protein [Pseudoalteromonas sp. meg-B1]PWS55725.1 hypothetical protein DK924_02840 [Pseudoalteromonas sp. meg-B1]